MHVRAYSGISRRLWALAAVAVATFSAAAQAQERRPRIDVQHYRVEADINPRTQSLSATVAVNFIPLDDRMSTAIFELHNALTVSRVVDSTGRELQQSRNSSDFTVRVSFAEPLTKGKAETITFTYDGRLTGQEESPIYGIRFASIQNDHAYLLYPARWIPTNDYTADAFAALLRISVPEGFKVVAPGLDSKESAAGRTIYQFDFTRPSFPASLAVVTADPVVVPAGGATQRVYFRGESAAMARVYGEEAGKQMVELTALFGLPPSAALTLVETDANTPNGYAAPGMIFLSTKAIGKEVNARLIANQAARQWWGNMVYPVTRNHIWIMHSMARYAELLEIEQASGPEAVSAEMKDVYVEALTVNETPISQSARLEDYSPEYWAVTSAKGTAVISMLRFAIGDEAFKKLIKEFPASNAWKAVSTTDLEKAAERIGQRDLKGFFIQWIESNGAPEFKLDYTVFRTSKGFRIMGKVAQDLDTFRMPVELKIETEGNPEYKTVEVVGQQSEFVVETFGRPKKVTADPNSRVLRYSDPMRVAVAIRRGEMFAEISEFGDALKEYQKALDTNKNSSLAHYRVAELFFLQRNYQSAANEFRSALDGDLDPKWIEVWGHINLGQIFDITGQRERAVNEYNLAIRTKDNTQGAQEVAAKYLKTPYERPAATF
ncbi:MAG: M1 family aminopeptidase [Acidobacteriota bacterium]